MPAAPKVFGIILAGGEGKRLMPLTADRAKPAVPFGGSVPADRLRDLEPHQLGAAPDRRADPVQVAQPRPPHLADVAHVGAARLVRGLGARAAAPRQAVVLGFGRRDPAEPQPDQRREARHRRRDRRRPRVPHGLPPDAGRPHRVRRARHGRRHPPADLAREPVRRHRRRRRTTRRGSTSSSRSRRTRPGSPTPRTRCSPRWATTSSTRDALIDAVEADGELPTSNHDMGGDIVPYFVGRGEAGVYDMKRNDVPGSTDRDRDYWRDVGTIDSFFDAHQDLISTLPIFNLYNMEWPIHSQTVNSPPAKFVRDSRRAASATRSTRSSRSDPCCRARISSAASSGRGPSRAAARRSPTRCCSTTCAWARARGSIARSSTRTSCSTTARRSASTASSDLARGFTVTDTRHHRRRQGHPHRALTPRASARDAAAATRGRHARDAPPASSWCSMPTPRSSATRSSSSSPTRRAAVPEVAAATEAAMRGEVDFAVEPALARARARRRAGVRVRPRPRPHRADAGRARADRRRARARRPGGSRLGRVPRDPRHGRPGARRRRLAREPPRRRRTARSPARSTAGSWTREAKADALRRVGATRRACRCHARSRSATAPTTCG